MVKSPNKMRGLFSGNSRVVLLYFYQTAEIALISWLVPNVITPKTQNNNFGKAEIF